VEGRPPATKGTWRNFVRLSPDELRQNVLSPSQAKAAGSETREAITHYEVIAGFPLDEGRRVVTKLRLWLETGRKHQIRAQAAHAGFPLVGDRAYNPGYRGHKAVDALIDFPRQALHAAALELEHPNQPGRHMKWAADLPEDLRKLETNLRAAQRR
jgi:23S rRNA pseudouridine1911/1915/1917 synthase